MRKFIISTDSTADLPKTFCEEHQIAIHPLNYILDGVEYGADKEEITPAEFYAHMREGKMPTTCASNPEFIEKMMREQVENGFDVLHISFSSALSSSYNNAAVCARNIMEEIEGSRIVVVDSASATAGQGLFVYLAVKMKEEGKTLDEIVSWMEQERSHIVHHFTVDDLHHLVRGGRLNKSAAVIGTALQLKPLLHVNNTGALETIGKVRGRKKAIKQLLEQMKDNQLAQMYSTVFITHADCYEEAAAVAERIKEQQEDVNIIIEDMCPTIGAHTGAGCLLVSYYGKER